MFTGLPGNHSITKSSFEATCTDLQGGFNSGWVSTPAEGVEQTPEWNTTIKDDTKHMWFFCKQLQLPPHCSARMVGAINAPTSGKHRFNAYKQAADKMYSK